jgi:lipopolysaccharide/colanic/teichoic acid biosynthesis glycosyltransferase
MQPSLTPLQTHEIQKRPPQGPSVWCRSRTKRMLDAVLALTGLITGAPVMAAIAVLVKLTSPGPMFFRQLRVGLGMSGITILKFRTMFNVAGGPGVTPSGDKRVTPLGHLLRKAKLDELPQLFNVLIGDLALVGPRPELPKYMAALEDHQLSRILQVRPGITSAATILFRNEEQILSTVPPGEVENFYLSKLLPEKVQLELEYAEYATFGSDLQVLFRTIVAIFRSSASYRLNISRG